MKRSLAAPVKWLVLGVTALCGCLNLKDTSYRFDAGAVSLSDAGVDAAVGASCGECTSPPVARCRDGQTVEAFPAQGTCSASGGCAYTSVAIACGSQCQAGACVGEACAGMFCDRPPRASCTDGTHLLTYDRAGVCSAGSCFYHATTIDCPGGCVAGVCAGNACAGLACSSPPSATCLASNVVRVFDGVGHCQDGTCQYASRDVTCSQLCRDGACVNDPCASVSCTQPPAPYCVNGTTVRTSAAPGVCEGGTCRYTTLDAACAADQVCTNGQCMVASKVCTAETCGDGCCDADTCRRPAQQSSSSCGSGAATCSSCGTGYQCAAASCVDLDECLTNHGGCDAHAKCTNTPGSRRCECEPGYVGDGVLCSASGASDAGVDGGADCSNPNGAETHLWFVNRYENRTLAAVSVDDRCTPVVALTLAPQTTDGQLTRAGDPWVVKDVLTGEVLFEGRAPREETTLFFPPTDTRVCSSVQGAAVAVDFRNRFADRTLSMWWVDSACREHFVANAAPHTKTPINTFVGHVFRFRDLADGGVYDVPPLPAGTTRVDVPSSGAPACSTGGGAQATVHFVNSSSKPVAVWWVTFECEELSIGTVNPGKALDQVTYLDHVFVLRDPTTQALVLAPAPIAQASTTITVF